MTWLPFDTIPFHSNLIRGKTTRFQAVLALLMIPVAKFTPPVTLPLEHLIARTGMPADRPNSYY
jgi:hypothetical protein